MAFLTLPSRHFVTRDSEQFVLGFMGPKLLPEQTRDLFSWECKSRKQYHLYSEAEFLKTCAIDQLVGSEPTSSTMPDRGRFRKGCMLNPAIKSHRTRPIEYRYLNMPSKSLLRLFRIMIAPTTSKFSILKTQPNTTNYQIKYPK